MNQSIPALLLGWQSYYVIIGSSGAALLYIGIHNAWDSITYTVLKHSQARYGLKS